MNKSRQRKLIERSIIFTITFIGVLFFMIFDFGFVYTYKLDGFRDLQWFVFWTHLSNMGALTWISLALIAAITNNQKLEHWLQHWNIKNTVFTFIITTGLIFILVAYFPVVIHYSKGGPVGELVSFTQELAYDGSVVGLGEGIPAAKELAALVDSGVYEFGLINGDTITVDPEVWYRTCVIVGTTFKHVIIPGMFIFLGLTELGYYRTKNISDFNRTMIQFIWPCLYLTYAITLSACGLVSPPYPVLDLGFTQAFYQMSKINQYIYVIASLILDLMVGFTFVATSMFLNWWNKSKSDKLGIDPILREPTEDIQILK